MKHKNNAYSVLNGSITNVATAITLATGTGSRFPTDNFKVTLIGYDGNGNENAWEICLCTSRTGDILTVQRGQEGTTAVAWANATRIENRVTADTLDSTLEPTITAGTTSQYWRGDKTWRDFFTDVRAATLTGLSTATNAVITATDTVLSALGKLQKQVSDNLTTLTAHTGNASNPHSTTAAQVGLGNVPNVDATNASNLSSGTVPDARITGTYTGFSYKFGSVTPYRAPSAGSNNTQGRSGLGLAHFRGASNTTTGAIVFIAPNTTSSIVYQLRLLGDVFNVDSIDLVVNGYRTTGAWSATKKISRGSMSPQVRWGVTPSGNNCLILGDVSTVWNLPHITLAEALLGGANATDAVMTDWTVALATDLTGYTNVTSGLVDAELAANINGNAATATALQTARTINGVSFNGTANITLPTVNTSGDQTVAGDKTFTGNTSLGNTNLQCISTATVGAAGNIGGAAIYGNGTSGAVMAFHRPALHAVNFGLDTDNVIRLGGWSDGANTYRFESDTSGNFSIRGAYSGAGATLAGNLTFTGARLILGDFSNATSDNRTRFQTSTANGGTDVTAVPNGTGTRAGYAAFNEAITTNAEFIAFLALASESRIWSGAQGAGATNPITVMLGATERARYSVAGGYSVGTTADPGAGGIYATGNITAYYSDRRLKDVAGKIENALDKVSKLSGVYYTSNDVAASFGYTDKAMQVGVLAQEVEAVLPEIVKPAPFDLDEHSNSKSGENYMTVQYERLVPLLIEAIKELNAKVKELEAR